MTSGNYGGGQRKGIPGWVWGLGACACLPIIGVIIFGLLTAPILKRIRESNREAERSQTCLANVKQIATGLMMYSQDYDDHLPPAATWMDSASSYVENSGVRDHPAFKCPTVLVTNAAGFGYAFNSKYSMSRLTKIPTPSQAKLVYDSSNVSRNAADAVTSLPIPARHHSAQFRRTRSQFDIMGYADGHARAIDSGGKKTRVPGMDTSGE